VYRLLLRNPEEKGPIWRPRLRWEDNIKMDCLLYINICANKYCKFILNYSDMFRC
jgi:hypothetical protein